MAYLLKFTVCLLLSPGLIAEPSGDAEARNQALLSQLQGLLIDETPQYQGVLSFFQWTRRDVGNASAFENLDFYPDLQLLGLQYSKEDLAKRIERIEKELLAQRGIPPSPCRRFRPP